MIPESRSSVALLALVFATKAATFPFGFWLPYSYPVVPGAVGAFFRCGADQSRRVRPLLRLFTLMAPGETGLKNALLLLAGFSILFGALRRGGAAALAAPVSVCQRRLGRLPGDGALERRAGPDALLSGQFGSGHFLRSFYSPDSRNSSPVNALVSVLKGIWARIRC